MLKPSAAAQTKFPIEGEHDFFLALTWLPGDNSVTEANLLSAQGRALSGQKAGRSESPALGLGSRGSCGTQPKSRGSGRY